MATGYTHDLKADTTLEQFVMLCAREFGATIEMRDEPLTAEIPEFQPSTFYRDELVKAQAELVAVQAWTEDEAREDQAKALVASNQMYREMNAKAVERRNVYDRMLALVNAWAPPTADHTELKRFMVKQLTTSREFDCNEHTETARPILKSDTWKAKRVAEVAERVSRYTDEWQREQERTAERNAWVRQLRESLTVPAVRG